MTPTPDIHRHLATTLRQLRAEKQWSLDRTAQETGLSKAMLGQIERGESSPTVASLWKIAQGFQCSLSHFLEAPASRPQDTLFRQVDTLRSQPASDAMLVAPIFPYDPHFGFEVFELTLLPHYVRHSEPHANGVTEHVIVISGQMEVYVDGVWQALAQGEAVRFAADREHGYRNLNEHAAVFHNLIHYPTAAR